MPRTCLPPRGRPASVAVEFAFVMIVLIPLLMGVWEIGRMVNVQQHMMNAAREACRQAATAEKSSAQVRDFALVYLQQAGLSKLKSVTTVESDLTAGGGKVYVDVKVYDTSGTLLSGTDARDAEQNYKVAVTVKVLFNDVEYCPTDYFLGTNATVGASVYWNCMRDVPLVVNDTIPLF